MKHIFLSPHFDDAIGSSAGLMKRLADKGAPVSVMTIMGGVPWRARISRAPKVLVRRWENARACRSIGVGRVDAGFLDAVFRRDAYPKKEILFDGNPLREKKLVGEIAKWIKSHVGSNDILYVPAGLGNHVDHRIVAAAAKTLPNKIIYYEEFYYDWKNKKSMKGYKKFPLAPDIVAAKIRAVKKYKVRMRRLFKGWRRAREYFQRSYERYSETPHIPELIVSFTSFPARIGTVNKTIETILKNTVRPDRVVLYLARPQFSKPPKNIKAEVRWTDGDMRSFKKLVPALSDFPEDFLITIDDDLLYEPRFIEKLWRMHKKYPESIAGMRARFVSWDENGNFLPYRKWGLFRFFRYHILGGRPRLRNLATTGGGTLFPPHALYKDAPRSDIFMKICPTTDDLWFWAMAVLNGTKTAVADYTKSLVMIDGSQEVSLSSQNAHGANLNDKSIMRIAARYQELKRRLTQS